MLQQLQQKNTRSILPLEDAAFQPYGQILTGFDTTEVIAYMKESTPIPEAGNIYIPSDEKMEQLPLFSQLQKAVYGGMDIQMGYCNGRNTTYNGCEYHKGSEITVAVTDLMLIFGHSYHIENNSYNPEKSQVFFVKEGTVFEIYQTTLHLSPCKVSDEGFKSVIVLPKGTNTPLDFEKENKIPEEELLLLKNKWIIAHKDREPLVKAGAHIGIIGENFELKY